MWVLRCPGGTGPGCSWWGPHINAPFVSFYSFPEPLFTLSLCLLKSPPEQTTKIQALILGLL